MKNGDVPGVQKLVAKIKASKSSEYLDESGGLLSPAGQPARCCPSWGASAGSEPQHRVMRRPEAGVQAQPVRVNDRAGKDPPGRAGVPLGLRAKGPGVWATEQGQPKGSSSRGGSKAA